MDRIDKAIELLNVSSGYRNMPVIQDLSLEISKGAICGIIGPNGSGKTTFLRTITRFIEPLAGSIRIFGKDTLQLSAAERAKLVGVVPQQTETPMNFTVEEIVTTGRTASLPRFSTGTAKDHAIVERSMVYTDVIDMKHRLFSELSGGERQRVIIAMVLAQEPQLMLLDEATSHLDMNHRLEVMQIIERLNTEHDITVVMVSHDLNLSAEFCNRLIMFDHGKIVSDGTPDEVLNEKTLKKVYHCNLQVNKNQPGGSITVTPAPRIAPRQSGHGTRIHVISGGGSGEEVVRLLSLCDYTITCGALNQQDSDAEIAEALGIDTALEKPFSPIGTDACNKANGMAIKSDAVVICPVPFGPGNLINLDIADQAIESKVPVFIMEGIETRDYTPDKAAVKKVENLVNKGARVWSNTTDLIDLLPCKKSGE
ncbi:hypothetical protein BVX94_02995 [bacterium B17]|nr:hypothetical protein BVX94_02995 [bacterium B17]